VVFDAYSPFMASLLIADVIAAVFALAKGTPKATSTAVARA
jgi:hypothetical protein